ncbi:MAG: hypothetical protein OIN87_02010 [Candidatus Methanoperedens sp.]|nr:hypothetical protein [Candidatus Methanoperedens sp.]
MNRCNNYRVEWIEYSSIFIIYNTAANDSAAKGTSDKTPKGISGISASILLTFTNPVFPDTLDPLHSITLPRTNSLDHNIIKTFRILGLMALISYMTVIIFTWMFANIEGYVYFSAGEPVLSIKYLEWLLGLLGIIVAVNYLQKELNEGKL